VQVGEAGRAVPDLAEDQHGPLLAVGSRVTRFAVGDEVYARPDQNRIGAFAELIAISQDDVAAKPATLTTEEAASLPLVALTAWQALVERGPPDPAFARELGASPVVRLAMAALSFGSGDAPGATTSGTRFCS
jgi:NADPH:quinone reductase-like Zn-dependent oxidoreductase